MARHTAHRPTATPGVTGRTRSTGGLIAVDLLSRYRVSGSHRGAVGAVSPGRSAAAAGGRAHSHRAAPAGRRAKVRVVARPLLVTATVVGIVGGSDAAHLLLGQSGATAAAAGPGASAAGRADSSTAEAAPDRPAGPADASPAAAGTPELGLGTQRLSRGTARSHISLAGKAVAAKVDAAAKPGAAKPGAAKPGAAKPVAGNVVAGNVVAGNVVVGKVVAGTWVIPTHGRYTSCFCSRWGSFHAGIDLAAPLGTPIVAVGDGTVIKAGPAGGFGNWIVVAHANGDVSIYGHMRHYFVKVGDVVHAGQTIAVVGAEGQSTGPHLHFEVHRGGLAGTKVDPVPWLRVRGVVVGAYTGS